MVGNPMLCILECTDANSSGQYLRFLQYKSRTSPIAILRTSVVVRSLFSRKITIMYTKEKPSRKKSPQEKVTYYWTVWVSEPSCIFSQWLSSKKINLGLVQKYAPQKFCFPHSTNNGNIIPGMFTSSHILYLFIWEHTSSVFMQYLGRLKRFLHKIWTGT